MDIPRVERRKPRLKLTKKVKSHILAFDKITNEDLLKMGIAIPVIFETLGEAVDVVASIVKGNYNYLTGREPVYKYAYDFFVSRDGYILKKPRDIFVGLLEMLLLLEDVEIDNDIQNRILKHYIDKTLDTSMAIIQHINSH